MTDNKKRISIKLSPKVFQGVLAALALVGMFLVGMWLGRAHSAAGWPGSSAIQQLRSQVVSRIHRQLQKPTPSPATASRAAEVPRIGLEEAREKLEIGANVVIVDVRSKEYFDQGHIKGALSLPLSEMEARYGELSSDKEIIIYGDRC